MRASEIRRAAGRIAGRLPRPAWWAIGATIACSGAVLARLIADQLPPDQRVPVWLAGGGLIFLGLAVLSLGSRAHAEADAAAAPVLAPPPAAVPPGGAALPPLDGELAAAERMVDALAAKEAGRKSADTATATPDGPAASQPPATPIRP